MYRIRFAEDSLMPDGHDYVLCSEHEDGVTLFYRDSLRTGPVERFTAALEASWAGYRELVANPEACKRLMQQADA